MVRYPASVVGCLVAFCTVASAVRATPGEWHFQSPRGEIAAEHWL